MKKLVMMIAVVFLGWALSAQAQEKKNSAKSEKQVVQSDKKLEKEKMKAENKEMRTKAKMESHTTTATKNKADGTPDRRYKENKKLKKDGTPDKRYKDNK